MVYSGCVGCGLMYVCIIVVFSYMVVCLCGSITHVCTVMLMFIALVCFRCICVCVLVICLLLSASFASHTIVFVFVLLMVVYNVHVKNIV